VRAAPRLTMVVTSRRVLHLSGEHVFPVQPLPADDAVTLFVERAQALDPGFALGEGGEHDVLEICRRLDGLPLAIELAAARTRMPGRAGVGAGLGERLALLTGGPRDLPARQQTLRDTLAWSTDLLDEAARGTLARLSVFAGPCSLEAVEAVCECGLDPL